MMEYSKWCWILLIIVLLIERLCGTEGCLEQERVALLQLKSFFYDLPDWENVKGSNCCGWERVRCSIFSERVIQLSLNSTRSGLFEYLNASLFLPFTELNTLYLTDNNIAGFVDDEGFTKLSSALKNLEILDLSGTYLSESSLSLLSELSSLKSLYLAGNGFTGSNATNGFEWFSRLRNLETLDLSHNNFNNDILLHVGGLSSLDTLNLGYNLLEGSVDIKELNRLRKLRNLDLSSNAIRSFQGFTKIGSTLKNLEMLDLSYNYKMDESILTSLSEISSLKSLYLAGNEFIGSNHTNGFAKLGSALRNLEILDLSYNDKLNNSWLSSLSELSSLKSLYLKEMNFRGSIHTNGFEWLSRLCNLETLDLSYNSLENEILLHVAVLSSLKTLNLGNNQLNGVVNIKELSRMRKLRNLDLSYNDLNNSILGVVGALSNLESLNLGGNQLKGSINIIKEVGSFRKLKYVNLDGFFLDGTVSLLQVIEAFPSVKTFSLRSSYLNKTNSATQDQLMNLSRNVEAIFIQDSHLSANILESIRGLTSLKSLTLSNCSLTGPLPTKGWCDLRNLEALDLSGNALEGPIPPCFHNLTSLRYLDFSYNHIEIPSSFLSFTNKSHLKFLSITENHLVREPTVETRPKKPKFQLKLLRMSNCSTKGPPTELPGFLYHQYDLRYIDLSYNKFGGENPSWLLENNTRLKQFLMAGNSFNGSLRLPKHANVEMWQLDMSQNKMEGQIPMNIRSVFPYLLALFLSQNVFEGNIPPSLGGLVLLDLSYNNFSGGMILEELSKTGLTLRLSNNNLSGKIPATLFNSSTLEQLYLDGNNFDGEIPPIDVSTVSSSNLKDIDLSNNHLSGKIPRWIGNLSNLETLVLSNNHFDGDHIPLELCNLGSLRFLDLSHNNLFGSVPSCFSSLTSLEHVHLSRNKMSGPLPRAVYNSSSLVTLDLSHNNFTGNIPNWISTLSALSILILKANRFEGEIPNQVCRLNSLSIIDLSQNKLFGQIPSCLSNLTLEPTYGKSFRAIGFSFDIVVLDGVYLGFGSERFYPNDYEHSYPNSYVEEKVAFTTKRGLYTYSGNILDYMSGIDLSCNWLTGQIPPELGNLSELRSLNLSHNELVGFIPSTFSKLKQVESLDISHNKLSGSIPIQLMELNSLAVFNVSYNNLSGNIPHEKAQFATFDESSYLGNPLLCGPPKNESCTGIDSTPTTPNASRDEEESGFLDKHVFYVTFVVSYTIVLMTIGVVLFINPYWRRAWFYFIGQCSETCYYFIVDNVLGLSIFRRST